MTVTGGSVAELSVGGGEFIAVIDPDGWLAPGALGRIEAAIAAAPDVDYLYTDEVVHGAGTAVTVLKPGWSLERQRWQDYCGQLSVFRRSLVDQLGGLDSVVGSAAATTSSCAAPSGRAGSSTSRCRRTTARSRRRRSSSWRLLSDRPTRSPCAATSPGRGFRPWSSGGGRAAGCAGASGATTTASVIMPTAGIARPVWGQTRPLVLGALRSLLAQTHHPRLEIVVVVDPATPAVVRTALAELPVVVVEGDGPFSFAACCNAGVAASCGEYVVLLNDDVLVEQPDWLSAMVGYFSEPDVGVVGARLLYADGTLQHGGILLNEHPRHLFAGFAADDPGPFELLGVAHEVSAVTGACLATPRAVWDELGGMSADFPVAFNDIDYCLRDG